MSKIKYCVTPIILNPRSLTYLKNRNIILKIVFEFWKNLISYIKQRFVSPSSLYSQVEVEGPSLSQKMENFRPYSGFGDLSRFASHTYCSPRNKWWPQSEGSWGPRPPLFLIRSYRVVARLFASVNSTWMRNLKQI